MDNFSKLFYPIYNRLCRIVNEVGEDGDGARNKRRCSSRSSGIATFCAVFPFPFII
jgi:hypothetical protein